MEITIFIATLNIKLKNMETQIESDAKKITNNFNYKLAISLFVLLVAIIYLGALALQSSKTYYLTIDEIQNTTDNTKSVRVAGKLVQDSYTRPETSTVSSFEIQDTLQPDIWESEEKLNQEISARLYEIAKVYYPHLKLDPFRTKSPRGITIFESSDLAPPPCRG